MIRITPLPAFSDNYIWCMINAASAEAVVVDPGDAAPVEALLADQALSLSAIVITHHHPDHTGGIDALIADRDIPVYGPVSGKIHQITVPLAEGDSLSLWDMRFSVIEVPGHTLDHIAYFSDCGIDGEPMLLSGDTLFAGGCGRIFEGNPAMMLASLEKLTTLLPSTVVYCAHEYTLANLAFAEAVEPDNQTLQQRIRQAKAARAQGLPTLPNLLSLEQATNPFLRCDTAPVIARAKQHSGKACSSTSEVFATIRDWKDRF